MHQHFRSEQTQSFKAYMDTGYTLIFFLLLVKAMQRATETNIMRHK